MKDDSDGRNDMPFRFSSPKWIGLQTVDQLSSFLELPAKWAFLAQKVSRNFAPSWPDFQRRWDSYVLVRKSTNFWSGLAFVRPMTFRQSFHIFNLIDR